MSKVQAIIKQAKFPILSIGSFAELSSPENIKNYVSLSNSLPVDQCIIGMNECINAPAKESLEQIGKNIEEIIDALQNSDTVVGLDSQLAARKYNPKVETKCYNNFAHTKKGFLSFKLRVLEKLTITEDDCILNSKNMHADLLDFTCRCQKNS